MHTKTNALQTREQRYTGKKREVMYISRRLIQSKPFRKLRGSSINVLMLFLTKRQMTPIQGCKNRGQYHIANNGEIQFTYREAKDKWGFQTKVFRNAIDQLVEYGFIDITHTGSGLHRDVTRYAVSDRWQQWGTDEFKSARRPKRKVGYGFAKKNTTCQKDS